MYSIVFTPTAEIHFEDAVIFFESKQKGLGLKFYEYVNKRIEVLFTYPYLPVVFKNIRVLQLKKYNYRLHYIILENKKQVRVISMIYAKSDPKSWKKFIR